MSLLSTKKNPRIDRSVSLILVNKICQVIKGPIIIYFLVSFLSEKQQGLWYTFTSLAALTVFAELGFTTIITQFVSHEFARLRFQNNIIAGEIIYQDKLFSLIRYAIKIYLIIVPIAVVILSVVGYFFLKLEPIDIIVVWIFFSFTSGYNLLVSLFQSIYQGLDEVIVVQKNIMLGSIAIPLLNCVMLYFGFGLWALVYGNFFGSLFMNWLLYKEGKKFWQQVCNYKISQKFYWFGEIVSLQWKYAVSWVSGFFIFSLYVPMIYKVDGAIVAGKLGLTLAIVHTLAGISSAWVNAKIPAFNMLVANKQYQLLNREFNKSFKNGILVFLLGGIALSALVFMVNYFGVIYANRLLPLELVLILILAELSMVIRCLLASYLRAFKEEPYYYLSLLDAILILIVLLFILPEYGLRGVVYTTLLISWVLLLPISVMIFIRFKNKRQLI